MEPSDRSDSSHLAQLFERIQTRIDRFAQPWSKSKSLSSSLRFGTKYEWQKHRKHPDSNHTKSRLLRRSDHGLRLALPVKLEAAYFAALADAPVWEVGALGRPRSGPKSMPGAGGCCPPSTGVATPLTRSMWCSMLRIFVP